MHLFDEDVFVPFLVFAVPIVAIAGGILAGIIKTISRHRLMEVAVRERMALIARGVDPARIPGLPAVAGPGSSRCARSPTTRGSARRGFSSVAS